MAIEIVSFPINSMVIFHSYVTVYQRVSEFLVGGDWNIHGKYSRDFLGIFTVMNIFKILEVYCQMCIRSECWQYTRNIILVGGLEHEFYFSLLFHSVGISSSQLTNSITFQRGGATTKQVLRYWRLNGRHLWEKK